MNNQNRLRTTLAWGVHIFTASGAAWGLLAIIAIQNQQWRLAMVWMVLAIIVDGFDGWLARLADVKTYAPGIDGALLDNLLDYLNYVIVPGLFLYEAELLPSPFAIPAILLIAITSAFQFTQTDAKTEDHYFTGFPSYWNVMAIYMLVWRMDSWVNLAVVIALNLLIFVPIKYVYPTRTSRLQRLTMFMTLAWATIGVIGLYQYPYVQPWVLWGTWVYIAYYLSLSQLPRWKKFISTVRT